MAKSSEKSSSLSSYRDLDVWKKAMDLALEIYAINKLFPDDEKFGLTSQIRRAAVSVPSNIAEGYGRRDRGDYRRHLSIANGSLKEVETQLILAGRLEMISKPQATRAWALSQDVGKMLFRLQTSLALPDTRHPTPETRS